MMHNPKPLIVAHRGESFDAPENTLAAINKAWNRGATVVEIDIQLTADNEIVVIHDTNTKRVSGLRKVIKKTPLAHLRTLDVGEWKASEFKGERIPTLNDVLETVPENGTLIIELKSNADILHELKQTLSESPLKTRQIQIIAFNKKTLAKAKQFMPAYTMLWLLDLDYFWPRWLCFRNTEKIISRVKKHNFDGINVWAGKVLNRHFIAPFKKQELMVYAWTINDPLKAKSLISDGIDAITTDRASWMKHQLHL